MFSEGTQYLLEALEKAQVTKRKTNKPKRKKRLSSIPSLTVTATPRVMSGLPPRQRIESADVQGGESSQTATRRPPTKKTKFLSIDCEGGDTVEAS